MTSEAFYTRQIQFPDTKVDFTFLPQNIYYVVFSICICL